MRFSTVINNNSPIPPAVLQVVAGYFLSGEKAFNEFYMVVGHIAPLTESVVFSLNMLSRVTQTHLR
jgi:hypothetical protein